MNRPNANQPPRRNSGVLVRSSGRPQAPEDDCPRANPVGTAFAVMIIAVALLSLQGTAPSQIAAYGAKFTAVALGVSVLFDLRKGLSNIIRADIMAMIAFYFLTLFEFLFPQVLFDRLAHPTSATTATQLVLLSFVGMLVGRHLIHPKKQPFQSVLTHEIPPIFLVALFWVSFIVGFMHQWTAPAVNWDFVKWIDFSMMKRFDQPWGRGKFGDFRALLYELNMLINLLPPLAGIILARRHRFGTLSLALIAVTFLFTLFLAFASGTRNVLATYLVTFVIGFAFASPRNRKWELIAVSVAATALLIFGTLTMIYFRTIGLKKYLAGEEQYYAETKNTLYVDYNLYNISELTKVFPDRAPYLGVEVAYLALIRPIPRAIWPGKPEGLSNSIEKALNCNAGNVTISASFSGEAYMAGGFFGVILFSLFFGAMNGWWSHLASPKNSELGILIYSSGFFAAVISMRSLFTYTTALLPTVAAIVGGTYLVRYLVAKARAAAFRSQNTTKKAMQTNRPSTPPQKLER